MRGTNRLEFQPLGGEKVLEEYEPGDMCRVKPSTLSAAVHGPALAGSVDPRVERREGTFCGIRLFSHGRREGGDLGRFPDSPS